MSLSSVSAAGMNSAWNSLNASAAKIASAAHLAPIGTAQPSRQSAIAGAGSEGAGNVLLPSLATDVVEQLQAKNAFLVNLRVFEAGDAMMGSLLDMKA